MKTALTIYVFVQLFSLKGFSQEIILKPNENTTPYFSFEEWIYSNSNWGYDSYGLTNFEPHSSLFSGSLEAAPKVFINGSFYNSQWLTNDLETIPNYPIEIIDSVVIKQTSQFNRGFFTPNGSIEIFTKNTDRFLTLNKSLVNEINDPGPHLSSDLETVNIDAINYNESVIISYPEFLNSKFVYSRDRFSYTNRLVYDRELNYFRFSRASSRRPDGQPRMPRNIEQEFSLLNQINAGSFNINTRAFFIYSPERYTWYPLTGIEIPAKHKQFQVSGIIKPVNSSSFRQSQFTFSHSSADSLEGTTVPTYGIDETSLSHSSSFGFPTDNGQVSLHLNNNVIIWDDKVTGNTQDIHDANLIIGFQKNDFQNLKAIIGNHTLGLEYERNANQFLSYNISTTRRNLDGNGYNFNLWNNGLGFPHLNKENHTVTNNSDFINTYSISEINSGLSKKKYQLSGSFFLKHYWQYVHTDTDYRFKDSGLQLDSDITYSDLNNVGFVGYRFFAKYNPVPKTFLKTSFSGHLFRYGSEQFINSVRNLSYFLFSQSIQYRADENAVFEIQFRYVSPRDIIEFEQLENNPIFTTAHVRPIYLLNATAKMWVIDRSLALTLALRNLLNSTESYNTNGQYYNMSISVGASIALRKTS